MEGKDRGTMKSIEQALAGWRAAQRRVQEANGGLTPEMVRDLLQAKQRYQELAAAHLPEQIDAQHAAEVRPAEALDASEGSTR